MYKIFFIMLFALTTLSVHSEELLTDQKEYPEVPLELRTAVGSRKKFFIKVPANFVPLSVVSVGKEKFYEFIPEGESSYLWNEIITVIQTPSTNNSLIQLLKHLEAAYEVEKEKCLYHLAEENGVKVAFLTADYPACLPNLNPKAKSVKIPGKNELLMMKIVQGKDGFAVVQFSVRYENKSDPEVKEGIKEKMLDFLNSCEIK